MFRLTEKSGSKSKTHPEDQVAQDLLIRFARGQKTCSARREKSKRYFLL